VIPSWGPAGFRSCCPRSEVGRGSWAPGGPEAEWLSPPAVAVGRPRPAGRPADRAEIPGLRRWRLAARPPAGRATGRGLRWSPRPSARGQRPPPRLGIPVAPAAAPARPQGRDPCPSPQAKSSGTPRLTWSGEGAGAARTAGRLSCGPAHLGGSAARVTAPHLQALPSPDLPLRGAGPGAARGRGRGGGSREGRSDLGLAALCR
jgi:hypothetical protein